MAQNSDNCDDLNIDSKETNEENIGLNNEKNDNEIKSQSINNEISVDCVQQNSSIDKNCDNINHSKSDPNSNQNNSEELNISQNNIENDLFINNNNENIESNINLNLKTRSPSNSDSEEDEEGNLLNYDPTPSVAYPSIKWHSLQQLQYREYGKLYRPGNKRPFPTYDSQWFRRYAYNLLYFFQRLELMSKFEEHSGCVNCLNFNSSGDLLISGSDDLRIAVWDWQKSRLRHVYHSGHASNVFQCRWCIDDKHIVSCARDGQIRICNIDSNGNTTSRKLAQHKAAAHKLTLTSPQVILSCGEDAAVLEIDLRADKPNKLLVVKNANEQRVPLYSINSNMVFSPLSFAISGRDPFVRVYDRRFLSSADNSTVNPVLSLCPENLKQTKHSVTCVQYNSNADLLLSTYNDDDIYTFDTKTGLVEKSYRGHRNNATVKGVSFFGDKFIVSGSDDGYVYGWDIETQHIVMSLYADENGVVNCIEPHPTTPIIATSGLDDNVKVWVPSADQWPQTLKGIKQVCFSKFQRI
jgi:WD repeat-containing protein 42A